MADIEMGLAFRNALHHGQDWLFAADGPYPVLFIDTEPQRPIGW